MNTDNNILVVILLNASGLVMDRITHLFLSILEYL